MFDVIGDIHGFADKLESLLQVLDYKFLKGTYIHPTRKVIFVGDYIDRGPQIKKTLEIVKSMVENESAIAIMGNHEYNALCFHYQETEGGHLRKHLIKNIIQHYETLRQFQNQQKEYENYLEWFKTLPLFYENELFRIVHACWDNDQINYLRKTLINDRLNDGLIYQSVKKGSHLNLAIEDTLKGKEIKLPKGIFFTDKDGTRRTKIRIKWWENPSNESYKSISVEPLEHLPESLIDIASLPNSNYYGEYEKPVFFGHYWLKGQPQPLKKNVACLDYSVAKEGHLVAYRMDDESSLLKDKMVFV
jgi:Calcineurin-like phosphoesterase